MSYPLIDICFVYRGRSSGISFQCVELNELNFDNHTKQSISRNKRVLWCFSHIMQVNFTGTQTTKCLQSVHSLRRERVWIGSKHTQTLWCWVRLTSQVLEPYVCVSLCKVEHCSWGCQVSGLLLVFQRKMKVLRHRLSQMRNMCLAYQQQECRRQSWKYFSGWLYNFFNFKEMPEI